MDEGQRDCRFDALLVSTCHKCGLTWIKDKVGQKHLCPEATEDERDSTRTMTDQV